MSVRVMTAVWDLALPAFEKLVLLALADCANDEGECWPSIATLKRKTGAGERTIQRAIQSLKAEGILDRREVIGKGCKYRVHPRHTDTPAKEAPAPEGHPSPPERRGTPATAAPKPSLNRQEPSSQQRARKAPIPDDWMPRPFAVGTESRKVVDGWPPGEEAAQLEQCKAHHRSKGNEFIDPQDAWSTWVLNSRKFGHGGKFRNGSGAGSDRRTTRESGERVAAGYASRGDGVVDLVPRLGSPGGDA